MLKEFQARVIKEIERIGHWPRLNQVIDCMSKVEDQMTAEAESATIAAKAELAAKAEKIIEEIPADFKKAEEPVDPAPETEAEETAPAEKTTDEGEGTDNEHEVL